MAQALNQPGSKPPVYYDSARFTDNESADAPVFHGFFGRQGGSSKGVYDSLNCGRGSDDNPANVGMNLQIIGDAIGVALEHILTQHQIHSDICTYVDKPWDDNQARPQADALVTDKAGLAIGVLTADCAPVLFFGKKKMARP